jgi:hypothetical protein
MKDGARWTKSKAVVKKCPCSRRCVNVLDDCFLKGVERDRKGPCRSNDDAPSFSGAEAGPG